MRHGQEPSVLDLVLTNEEGLIENIEYGNPLGKMNHLVLHLSSNAIENRKLKTKIYKFMQRVNMT